MKYTLNTWGLSKRELFSGLALQGMVATTNPNEIFKDEYIQAIAKDAVRFADALLAELGTQDGKTAETQIEES